MRLIGQSYSHKPQGLLDATHPAKDLLHVDLRHHEQHPFVATATVKRVMLFGESPMVTSKARHPRHFQSVLGPPFPLSAAFSAREM